MANRTADKESSDPNEENTDMKTTANPLPMLLGCAGLASVSWGMPTHALAAFCARPPYPSGPHALSVPARSSAGIVKRLLLAGSQQLTDRPDASHRGLLHTIDQQLRREPPETHRAGIVEHARVSSASSPSLRSRSSEEVWPRNSFVRCPSTRAQEPREGVAFL